MNAIAWTSSELNRGTRHTVARLRPQRSGWSFIALALLAAASLALSGCGGGEKEGQSKSAKEGSVQKSASALAFGDNTLINTDDEDPKHLDPIYVTDIYEGHVIPLIYDGLVVFKPGPQVEIQPGLAERWDISPDGLVYTFHLRQGVKFHKGEPFTAQDVKFSLERLLSPFNTPVSPRRTFYDLIHGAQDFMKDGADRATSIDGVTVVDDHTVQITLDKPFVPFVGLLAMPNAVILPASVGEQAKNREYLTQNPNGTGPWILDSWQRNQFIIFRRNTAYWGGAPKAESLVWRAATVDISLAQDFEIGNVDFINIPDALVADYLEDAKWKPLVHKNQELNFYYWAFNCQRPPYDDARVRQAISHAINVDLILKVVNLGRGVRAFGATPPGIEGYREGLSPWPYDPGKARELLKQAGRMDANNRANFGVELWIPTDDLSSLIAEQTRDDLDKVGIKATIIKRENTALKQAIRTGEFDIFFRSWWADYPDIENFLYPCFHSANWQGGGNGPFYKNAEVDRLIDEARFLPDPVRRIELFQKAEDIARGECPYVFLWHRFSYRVQQPWINNFTPSAMYNAEKFVNIEVDITKRRQMRGKK